MKGWTANTKVGLNDLQKKQCRKIAKTAAKSRQEVKRTYWSGSTSALACSAYVNNPFFLITQGTAANNRIANTIYVDSVQINIRFSTNLTTNKEVVLWFFAYFSDETAITSATTPTQIASTNITTQLPIVGNTGLNFGSLAFLDKFQMSMVRDRRMAIPIHVTGVPGEFEKTIKINFKGRKMVYELDSASYFEGKNFYFGIVADAQGSTVDTTNLGTYIQQTMVNFRE